MLIERVLVLRKLHLHGSGWVHRDISTGNILYVPEADRWVLSDVEYAKRLNSTDKYEIRVAST